MPSVSCAGAKRVVRVDVDAHDCGSHVRKPNCDAGSQLMETSAAPAITIGVVARVDAEAADQ